MLPAASWAVPVLQQGASSGFLPCYPADMTKDARRSLIALGSMTLFVGLLVASLSLLKGIDIPNWILPLGWVLMTIEFDWRFFRWTRAKHATSEDTPT